MDTRFSQYLRENKKMSQIRFFPVHMGPRWSFLFKKGSKILCHCPFKLFSLAKGSLAVGAGPVGLPGVRFIEDEVSIVESDIDDKISNGICHL